MHHTRRVLEIRTQRQLVTRQTPFQTRRMARRQIHTIHLAHLTTKRRVRPSVRLWLPTR